ncbi:hypothetical protein PVAND_010940 [Polypedilum vanderplanki]|uniref:PDZ domain-containing protein n=1 Tax=Polypedilum vanderplanki TaxID=319348 RepID=A0A9J6CH27_POLVA|nr:hypothetical protein PVAND_010940 [Polypedilum vanderplanki]
MFDYQPKCPGMLTSKLTSIFGWRHTYNVHDRQKGLNHFKGHANINENGHNLQKSYSLNLPPKKHHKITASNPSLPEASSSSSTAATTNPESWVVVHHLQSQSGILDPDDRVNDVADDREQILASFDDRSPDPGIPQGGGDGASGSSVGTGSPDIFRIQDGKYSTSNHHQNESIPTHIDVTESDQPPVGLTLQVRRGSEPSLLALDQNTQLYPTSENSHEPSKRWSAAPVCRDEPERLLNGAMTNGSFSSPKWTVPEEEISNETMPSTFTRSGRLSMQFLGDGANYRWIEAAEKAAHNLSRSDSSQNGSIHANNSNNNSFSSKSLPRDAKQRKEPLGQANVSSYESIRQKNGEMLLVTNESGGQLGLTAIPDRENGGLLVQSVEPDSRAEKGRLRRGDRILEINGVNLMELSEASVQEQLKKCIASSELRLRVIRAKSETRDRSKIEMFEAEEKASAHSKVAHVSPTRKPGTIATSSLQAANTRKLGRKIEITLKKGAHGLGFSVTTRDNPAGGHCPIYIKNILPKGAAIEDGRLKPGDRLLEVDNVAMTGKSQAEVVNILRATQPGAVVKIVVSRQQEIPEVDEREIGSEIEQQQQRSTTLPKQPPPPILPKNVLKSPSAPNINEMLDSKSNSIDNLNENVKMKIKKFNSPSSSLTRDQNANIFPWRNREILTFHIPVHDSEKAGLGVSVKGKTGSANPNTSMNTKHDGDLGIFIKSVLHGGAASRDGRLKMNDQLLSVNGISLLGQSNADAMDTLRRAMLQTGGKHPGVIVLKIARRASSRPNSTIENGEQHVVDSSGNTSEQSGSTVIYLSPNDKNSVNQQKEQQMSPNTPQENGKRWSNPVLDRLTGGTGNSRVQSTLIQMPGGLRNDSYYMATNENWSPNVNLNNSNGVLIEEDSEPTSPILPIRPDFQHQISASTPTSAGDITYASQLSLENPVDAFSRDAIGRRSMSEKHHAALDAKETGTYQRNKKIREEREKSRHVSKTNSQIHSSIESLTNMNRIGSMKTRQKSDLRSEAMDKVTDLGPSLGMKKSSSLESLQTMVQEIQMSDEPRGPNALRAPRGRGREEILRAAVERPESQPRKHWLLEENGTNDNDGGFSNRGGTLQSSTNEGKIKDQKKGFLKGIGHMFRFGKHRKDVYPAQTEVITDYTSWSNDVSAKSATLGSSVVSSPSVNSNTSQQVHSHNSSHQTNSQNQSLHHHQQQQQQKQQHREPSHERQLSGNSSNGPPSYHAPPTMLNGHGNSKITQNDLFNHRYSHYVNYDELQLQISRRNQHYHSQRSARNVDLTHFHQYNGLAPIANGHKYPHPAQQQQQPQSMQQHHMRPISSYYEYETINPNGHYRKLGEHFIPLQNSNSSSKIINGTSSVRVSGSTQQRGPIPDMNMKQHRGPFITQVHIRDQNGNKHPSASKMIVENHEMSRQESTKSKKSISFKSDDTTYERQKPISYWEALANLFKANVGTGCFGMADAIKNAGIILGPIATIIIAIICVECMRMLLVAAEYIMIENQLNSRPDYSHVVELSFSKSKHERWRKYSRLMRLICNISLCLTQFGFCCVYILFVTKSSKIVLDYYGIIYDLKIIMAIVLIPILMSALVRQLKNIAIFSGIANICMIIGAAMTLIYCIDLPPLNERAYIKLDTLPLYFGTALFAFEGISLVLPLQNSMKKPENFSKFPFGVLHIGMSFVSIIYTVLGTMGYWKFGEQTEGSLTLNLPTDQILAQIIITTVSLGVLLTYAIQFFVGIHIMLPPILRNSKTAAKFPILTELIFRTLMVFVTFIIAMLVPNLSLLLSLIGSVCCVILAFIFPSIVELMTSYDKGKIGVFCWIKNIVILILALCGFILGGGLALKGIYDEFIATHL